MPRVAPCGTWASPVTLEALVADGRGPSFPLEEGDWVYWCEARPAEGGRTVVLRAPRAGGGATQDVFGADHSARTTVHEYGGLCIAVWGTTVYFANGADQRLWRVDPGGAPVPITPEPPVSRAWRFAAPVPTPDGRHLVCVRERHQDPDLPATVMNDLVAVRTDGGGITVVADGHDFYSHPVLSPDGRHLAWTCWDHPNMPWDGTELWEAALDSSCHAVRARKVAGGPTESVTQPKYAPDGGLLFVSDRTGWWNLYAAGHDGEPGLALAPMEAELGAPDWQFGTSNYAVVADGSIVATWSEGGLGRLGLLRPGSSAFELLESRWTSLAALRAGAGGDSVLAVAASATEPPAIVRLTLPSLSDRGDTRCREEILTRSRMATLDSGYLSVPEAVSFPTDHGRRAHALFYPPANADFDAPESERPPLVVTVHGGPTSRARPSLDYSVQFWTSRGFAVVDVDYGGSTGYGREYRERMRGQWGVVDV
ncbi:MAG: S9 family peptidase, partial [Acidimicrobiales bacterium]